LRDYRATKIQNRWRVTVAKKMLKQHRAASIKIQAFARGARQRPIYRTALAEAIEEAKLGNQLKTLQRKLEEAEKRRIEAEKKAEEGPKEVVVYKEVDKPFDKGKKVESPPKQVSQAPVTVGQLTSQQQTLMDESGKMLEYLRKEVLSFAAKILSYVLISIFSKRITNVLWMQMPQLVHHLQLLINMRNS